jgi:competence protein ComEC
MSRLAMPLAPLAIAFASGIAIAPWARADVAWAAWLASFASAGALLLAGRTSWAATLLVVSVVAVGALRGIAPPLPSDHVARLELPRIAWVDGRLADEPVRWAPDRLRVLIDVERVDGLTRSGRILATVNGVPPPRARGQRITAELRLHPAIGFRNPGTFDYAEHLAREGIRVTATVRADRLTPGDNPTPPWPTRIKRESLAAIWRALPPASAALLAGLLLGERTDLPHELDEGFRRAGVYHVLAVSGFNVALLAAAVFALCRLARVGRRPSAVVAMVVVVGFAAVVGPEPSVLRAVVMAVLVLAALLLEREASVTNSLALAALAILAVRPADLADPGFQLSFAATAAIVAAPMPHGVIAGAIAVSAAAQVAVLPITLSHFNQLSTIGVIANLGVVPLAGVATVAGLLAVGASFLSESAAQVGFDAVWPVLLALRAVVALAAAVPGAVVHLPAPHWTAIACYAAALVLGLVGWCLRAERPHLARPLGAGALVLLALAIAVGAWPALRPPDGRLRVIVVDVGQGDAIVLEAPDGRALLVDAGAGGPMRLDVGERVVAPFLWNRGHLRLAGALVTHQDTDHAGGMKSIRRLFAVASGLDAEGLARGPLWIGGAILTSLGPGEGREVGGRGPSETRSFWASPDATREPLAQREGWLAWSRRGPGPRPLASRRGRNDEAIVLRIEYGLASFLLASDIEAAREQALVASGAPLAATVLKVAHHGSHTSSTPAFLRAVRPAIAVVSVGTRNSYGHPDAGVIDRLAASGASVYRTDRDGAVIFETDGRTLAVTRWAARATDRFCLDPEAIC